MAKTAQENMVELQKLGGKVDTAETAADALQRLESDPDDQVDPDGEAEFGTAEAIITGIIATALLGPLGGILIGGAQGILQKKAEQSVLDKLAAENDAITDSRAVYDDQFTALEESAKTPEDLEQISAIRSKMNASYELMTSGSDKLQQAGLSGFATAQNDLLQYSDRNETQRIAREENEAQLERELGKEQYNRFTKLQDDFTNESAGYLTRQKAGVIALDALQNGSPSDLHAAMILFNKTLDPNSAVLGEERTAITEMGGWLDKGYNFINKAHDGSQMNASQRRKLGATIERILGRSTEFQLMRESSYSDQLSVAELPVKFNDNFRLVKNTPAAEPLDIPNDFLDDQLELDQKARDAQSIFINDTIESTIETTERVLQGAADAWDAGKKELGIFNETIKGGRGLVRPTN